MTTDEREPESLLNPWIDFPEGALALQTIEEYLAELRAAGGLRQQR